jgi:alkylation response protein AidB-like acyl-CoA dehydrogenase
MTSESLDELLTNLQSAAPNLAQPDAWPGGQLASMSDAGVLDWLIPKEFGGSDITPVELVIGYEKLAAACLTSVFVLTQRNAAIQRLVRSPNFELKDSLLRALVDDSIFATVGISHLTTSRQHWKQPTVRAKETTDGFILNGDIPWVTGADRADVVISGGTLEDGRQLLVALRMNSDGVTVRNPETLLALNASRTASIQLTEVFVPVADLVVGPVEDVMKVAGGGAGSHTTSALAVGHSAAAVKLLRAEADKRPDLQAIAKSFESELTALQTSLREAAGLEAQDLPPHLSAETLRQQSNSLALRSAQAGLAASKGAGFVAGHPASRLVSEAMFFLVWSCPQPVVLANLRELAGASSSSSASDYSSGESAGNGEP